MSHARWSAAEIEKIEQLCGNVPGFMVRESYNQWAASQSLPLRSERSIGHAIIKWGSGCSAVGNWVTTCYVADLLGLSLTTVVRWELNGLIPCIKQGPKRFLRRSDIIELARSHPERFAGISASRLYSLLEDRALSNHIARNYPYRHGLGRPVMAVEPQWNFPSVSEAARHFHVVANAIQFAIRSGGKSAGYHWIRL